ncbi:MAG: nucleotidyl transferase AbiEii/AbiGii toxin family protein [Patescibacteria group bacterium]
MMYKLNTLPTKTRAIFDKLTDSRLSLLDDFYLSGGTGLSLQLGHRQSEDLDFFCERDFSPELILSQLKELAEVSSVEIAQGTLNVFMGDVKLQFLNYPYKLLESLQNVKSINISSVLDIACTKIITISSRGSKKDFVDLYFILKHYSLDMIFTAIDKKYEKVNFNSGHLIKSLVFFIDADQQPMPRLIDSETSWEEMKKSIQKQVMTYIGEEISPE